jgi:hypothetical protein
MIRASAQIIKGRRQHIPSSTDSIVNEQARLAVG